MATRTLLFFALLLAPAAGRAAASATEEMLLERIDQLEQRIDDLEANQPKRRVPSESLDWTRRVRLGGSANVGYFGGQRNSNFDPDSFDIWDARLFVDADLGQGIGLGERTIVRNVGFSFEWDLVRIGNLQNQVGDLYVDLQGLFEQDAANAQVGRFQIPVGEAYHLYGHGTANKPFVSNPVGGPWWWDEGIRLYGSGPEGRFGYVSSISDGETPFNADSDEGKQLTLKLFVKPWPWLYLSASGLRSGEIGSDSTPANGALWLGESWARAFGSGSGVPNFQDGAAIADGPNQIEETWLAAGDAILDFRDRARLWLAYGRYAIDSRSGTTYDRVLHYWIAELLLRGAWASDLLRPFYVGVRANALGTYDGDEGYLLDVRRSGSLGYNMESLTEYSAVLGWELSHYLRLRAEYTRSQIDLVRGVTSDLRAAARDADFFAIELGASF